MELLTYMDHGLLFAILIVLVFIAVTGHRLRSEVAHLRSVIESGLNHFMFDWHTHSMGSIGGWEGGFCIWVFRGGKWTLEGDFCLEGYEPGPPPCGVGLMEGYAVRQLAVRKRPL